MQITTKRRLFGELLISVKLVELAPVLSWHYATKTKRHNITLKDKIRSCGDTVVCIIAQPHEMCSRMAHSRPQIFAAMSLFQLGKGCCPVEHLHSYFENIIRSCSNCLRYTRCCGCGGKVLEFRPMPDGYSFRRSPTTALLADTK